MKIISVFWLLLSCCGLAHCRLLLNDVEIAVRNNKADELQSYLNQHPDHLSLRFQNGSTLFHLAISSESNNTIRMLLDLLEHSNDTSIIDEKKSNGDTALHLSCRKGMAGVGGKMLEISETLLNMTNNDGKTALFDAVESLDQNTVEMLIEKGADVFHEDKQQWKPVHHALVLRNWPAMIMLIEQAQAVEKCCGLKLKSLSHLAAEFGIHEFIESKFFNETEIDADGQVPICYSIANENNQRYIFMKKYFDIFPNSSILKMENACKYFKNQSGTPLHAVAAYERLELAYLFMENGANIEIGDSEGMTVLHLIAMNKHEDLESHEMEMLARNFVNENKKSLFTVDNKGRNPFLLSAVNSNIALANYLSLVYKNISTSSLDNDGNNAFHLTSSLKFAEFLLELESSVSSINEMNSNGETPLQVAVIEKKPFAFVEYLLERGADPRIKRRIDGKNILHFAVENGYEDVIKRFANHAVASMFDVKNKTALFSAIEVGKNEIVKLFIRGNSRNLSQWLTTVIESDEFSGTLLHLAVDKHNFEIVKLLIESAESNLVHVIMANAQNRLRRNALHEAAIGLDLPIVKVLMAFSPQMATVVDKYGRIPIHYVSKNFPLSAAIAKVMFQGQNIEEVVEKTDNFGENLWTRCVKQENSDIIRMLLNEFDVECPWSVVELASRLGYNDIANIMIRSGKCNEHIEHDDEEILGSFLSGCKKISLKSKLSIIFFCSRSP